MRALASIVLTLLAVSIGAPAVADEGMWLPSQLPQIGASLYEVGHRGDPAVFADLTRAPLNAVVKVGGATGAFVSAQGLVLTNHHVAFGVIQYNSGKGGDGVERDLIGDGYIASGLAAELPANPDFRVLVTTAVEDITDTVLAAARGKRGRAYHDAVMAAGKAAVAECEREAGQRCSVVDMYYGLQFQLIRQLELKDIRLVYAPPRAIGNYGDEVDNFMWPRHSGDFTLLRAYVGRDGRPAPYAPDNVPYTPPSYLPISTAAIAPGDHVMLAGYPGVTHRHRMASEFAQQVQWQLPWRVRIYGGLIDVIERAGASDEDARIAYAAQLASLKNMHKRAQGELEGLQRSDAVAVRAADEAAMLAWLDEQDDAAAMVADIRAAQTVLDRASATRERDQLLALMRRQTQLLSAALELQRLAHERAKPDIERESGYQQRDEALIEGRMRQLDRRYRPRVEKALLARLLERHRALPAAQRVAELDAVFGADEDATGAALDVLYANTRLADADERRRLLRAAPSQVAQSDDSLLRAAARLLPAILRLEAQEKARDGELLRLRPAYMRASIGYRKSQGRILYPDANSTLRVSYGRVSPLAPRDGVEYLPLTTVRGIVEKNTGRVPFDAPPPLLAAIAKGDFGSTLDPTSKTQNVNFLSNLDTTGGNSGSPVLDAEGKLVGLNFDSNWEAVSASWMYDPRYKRAIHVDMRYLRWLLAKVYPAPHLLRELALPVQ